MNPEIEKLIEFALADGVISERERQIIRKKAEKLGEDPDEAEMILDAKLTLKENQTNTPPPINMPPVPPPPPGTPSSTAPIEPPKTTPSKPPPNANKESSKVGNIMTCPVCGASVKAMELNCSECGHEFHNTNLSKLMSEFMKKLEHCELTHSGNKVFINKASIISNYQIPNNKEDIIDFITFSVSQANSIKFSTLEKIIGTYLLILTYSLYNKNKPKKTLKNAWVSMADSIKNKAQFLDTKDNLFIEKINELHNKLER